MPSRLLRLPPPLWGRSAGVADASREGGGRSAETNKHPPPHPSPTRGEGADCGSGSAACHFMIRFMTRFASWTLVALAASAICPLARGETPAEPVVAHHAMVVSQEKRATHIGLDVLERGGNAVDAAVAVGFALAVTHPTAGNLGGGGFMLIRLADGTATAIDYRETAPQAATRDMFLDEKGEYDPSKSRDSGLAVGVPGTVA